MSIYNSSSNSLEERKKHFIERLNKKYPNFEYISGYVNSECDVLLRCNKCGELQTKKSSCVRSRKKLTCFNCKKIEKHKKELAKKVNKLQLNYYKEQKMLLDKIAKRIRCNTLYIKICSQCNNEYIEHTTSNYCAKCRRKIHDKHSQKSLKKLYDRDKGICWLCGEQCNWNDKELINGTIVVGKSYPSIDHKIPLSKGGTDDWDNLGLAHCKCNWLKGAC